MKRCSKDAILVKFARTAAAVIIGSLLYTPPAFAELDIHEVQPWPIDSPTQLVIWGLGFDNPEILFGTHAVPLIIDDSEGNDSEGNMCTRWFGVFVGSVPGLDK